MCFRRLIKSGSKHGTRNFIAKQRDVLRIDINQQHQHIDIRIIVTHNCREMLHDFCLARLRRTEHQPSLAETEGSNQINETHIGKGFTVFAFKRNPAGRIYRR